MSEAAPPERLLNVIALDGFVETKVYQHLPPMEWDGEIGSIWAMNIYEVDDK